MLKIRREQVEALLEPRLQLWWYDQARAAHPHRLKALGDAAFRERIRQHAERARQGGIEDPAEIARFIDLALLWGHEFDTPDHTPWVEKILGWEGTDSQVKIAALFEESERARDERWLREQRASGEQ